MPLLLALLLLCARSCTAKTILCGNLTNCVFSGDPSVNSYVCSNSNGDCNCGAAVDCTCLNSNGACNGQQVT
jgi:hypothetical protein